MKNRIVASNAKTRFLDQPETIGLAEEQLSKRTRSGEAVVLDAVNIMGRPDFSRAFQYTWRLLAAPGESGARMEYSTFVRARFVPDYSGQYIVVLEATTSRGVREYITRVAVDATGEITVEPAYLAPTLDRGHGHKKPVAETDRETIQSFAFSANGGRRTKATRRRRPFFRRLRFPMQADTVAANAYGEPVSTF